MTSRRKGLLQKISTLSAGASLVLALVTGVFLYLRLRDVGSDDPLSASLMAATFFFLCVGFVLGVMGRTDIPNFRFDESEE